MFSSACCYSFVGEMGWAVTNIQVEIGRQPVRRPAYKSAGLL
ncbi:hypothetical protein DSUL_150020 [Desulfovibrionales bacterium]